MLEETTQAHSYPINSQVVSMRKSKETGRMDNSDLSPNEQREYRLGPFYFQSGTYHEGKNNFRSIGIRRIFALRFSGNDNRTDILYLKRKDLV